MIATWTNARRENVLVGSMGSEHIRNCIRAIRRGRIRRSSCNGFTNAEWILIFQTELVRRNRG
jgi:hypothetical protein